MPVSLDVNKSKICRRVLLSGVVIQQNQNPASIVRKTWHFWPLKYNIKGAESESNNQQPTTHNRLTITLKKKPRQSQFNSQ
jgi:hypothetical protein